MIKQMSLYDALILHPECEELILHKTSGMGGILNCIKQDPHGLTYNVRFAKSAMVWLYFQKENIVAWSWLFQKKAQGSVRHLSFFVFCKSEIRKKGIGRELFYLAKEMTRKKHRRMLVYPWNIRSDRFYDSLNVPRENQLDWIS